MRHALGGEVLQHLAVLQDYGGGNAADLLQVYPAVALGDDLRRGISDAVDVAGQDAHRTGRYVKLRQGHATGLQPHATLGGDVLQTFVVVDEDETAVPLRAVGPAQVRVVPLGNVLGTREGRLHRRQHFPIVLHEEVQLAQHVVVGQGLPELPERSLEVVVLHGHVVVVRGRRALHLVEPGQTFGVGTSVIHVVPQEVGTAAQFHQGHGIGILGIDVRTAVVGRHHAATQFAGEVGVLLLALRQLLLLLAQLLRGDGGGGAERLEVESLVVVARRLLYRPLPEAVGIVAIERQHLTEGYRLGEFGPTRTGVERQVETDARGYAFQGHEVVARTAVFVVKLARYERSAILPLQSLYL